MKWYRELYLGKSLDEKKEKLIKRIECNAGTPGIYVITLAANEKDLFDIFSADILLQPVMHGHCPMIVGLTSSREEAIEIVQEIVLSAWSQNSSFDMKRYLAQQAKESPMFLESPMEKLKPRKRLFFGKK